MFGSAESRPFFYFPLDDSGSVGVSEPPLRYTPDHNFNADHAEFFVSSFARGHINHTTGLQEWLDVWFRVFPQPGRLLTCGMLVRLVPGLGDVEAASVFISGTRMQDHEDASETWKLTFTNKRSGAPNSQDFAFYIHDLSFFVDVEHPTGEVIRLWQSNLGNNYTVDEIFTQPGDRRELTFGFLEFANEQSVLFDQKRACLTRI